LNHTLSVDQVDYFKAGSALNLIAGFSVWLNVVAWIVSQLPKGAFKSQHYTNRNHSDYNHKAQVIWQSNINWLIFFILFLKNQNIKMLSLILASAILPIGITLGLGAPAPSWYYNQPARVLPKPAAQRMTVNGNNGYTSCDNLCQGFEGQAWNNLVGVPVVPNSWNGAKCVGASNGFTCSSVPQFDIDLQCTCEQTGAGWYQGGMRTVKNGQWSEQRSRSWGPNDCAPIGGTLRKRAANQPAQAYTYDAATGLYCNSAKTTCISQAMYGQPQQIVCGYDVMKYTQNWNGFYIVLFPFGSTNGAAVPVYNSALQRIIPFLRLGRWALFEMVIDSWVWGIRCWLYYIVEIVNKIIFVLKCLFLKNISKCLFLVVWSWQKTKCLQKYRQTLPMAIFSYTLYFVIFMSYCIAHWSFLTDIQIFDPSVKYSLTGSKATAQTALMVSR
jgi:hypothetical protein